MSWFRAIKSFEHHDQRGNPVIVKAGQLVDVLNRHEEKKLKRQGKIRDKRFSWQEKAVAPAPPRTATLRVGLWLRTSRQYSGGRIHLWQYALCLARAGAEVWMFTDLQPRWARDYPGCDRLQVVTERGAIPPADLDLAVTDSKGEWGPLAADYARLHDVPLVCWNFETPNWVAEYCPEYARRLEGHDDWKALWKGADLLVCNSELSRDYLLDWIEAPGKLSAVLPPAINTAALAAAQGEERPFKRRYAVWSARSAAYKGSEIAQKAVWGLEEEFDLVTFGRPVNTLGDTELHKLHKMPNAPDVEKFRAMLHAEFVLAPSKFEGFGMVPMEALACGKDCLVYDLPVLRQSYGERLSYVEWGNGGQYTSAVRKLAQRGHSERSEATSTWATTTYGLDAMAERIEHLPYHAVKRRAVSAQMICYATPTAPAAVRSIYPHVDEIIIAYGPTRLWRDWPEGGILEQLRELPDPDKKIRIEARDVWTDKREMRSWAAEQFRGNYLLMLDGDEIWVGLEDWLERGPEFGSPRWVTFWHDREHWIHDTGSRNSGRRWGYPLEPFGSVCPHYRWSRWRPSFTFARHHTAADAQGNALTDLDAHRAAAGSVPETVIYHLGHALPPELIAKKHEFYQERDGAPAARHAVWDNWNGEPGLTGDGKVRKVDWELPNIVTEAFDGLQ